MIQHPHCWPLFNNNDNNKSNKFLLLPALGRRNPLRPRFQWRRVLYGEAGEDDQGLFPARVNPASLFSLEGEEGRVVLVGRRAGVALPEDIVGLHAAVLVTGANHSHPERRGGHGWLAGRSSSPPRQEAERA